MGTLSQVTEIFRLVVEWATLGIEIIAVAVIVAGILILIVTRGTVRYLFRINAPGSFERYKNQLAKPLMLGLDLMVAADVIESVVLERTMTNIVVLGLLVLIRTFLGWSMAVEIEGRWPWKAATNTTGGAGGDREPVAGGD